MNNIISLPFDSLNMGTAEEPIYDRAITFEQERAANKALYFTGINCMPENGLEVTPVPDTLAVNVAEGLGCIEGALFVMASDAVLELEAADATMPRIDRVVIRLDDAEARDVNVYVLTGTPAEEPEPPTITCEDGFYELASADVLVLPGATSIAETEISDLRGTVLCPFVVMSMPVALDGYSF